MLGQVRDQEASRKSPRAASVNTRAVVPTSIGPAMPRVRSDEPDSSNARVHACPRGPSRSACSRGRRGPSHVVSVASSPTGAYEGRTRSRRSYGAEGGAMHQEQPADHRNTTRVSTADGDARQDHRTDRGRDGGRDDRDPEHDREDVQRPFHRGSSSQTVCPPAAAPARRRAPAGPFVLDLDRDPFALGRPPRCTLDSRPGMNRFATIAAASSTATPRSASAGGTRP